MVSKQLSATILSEHI